MSPGETGASARRAARTKEVREQENAARLAKIKAVECAEIDNVALACPGHIAIHKTRKTGRGPGR